MTIDEIELYDVELYKKELMYIQAGTILNTQQ